MKYGYFYILNLKYYMLLLLTDFHYPFTACNPCRQCESSVYLPVRPSKLVNKLRSVYQILFGITLIFLLQVSQYITEGLERARHSLTEAAALRERFVLGTSVSRRVAAAAASAVTTFSHALLLELSTEYTICF